MGNECNAPRGVASSVHLVKRFVVANREASEEKFIQWQGTDIKEKVIEIVTEYLNEKYNMNLSREMVVQEIKTSDILEDGTVKFDYGSYKEEHQLNRRKDIVWIKFTNKGQVGVVACSDDINFNYPSSMNDYIAKDAKGNWAYNSSGILVHSVGLEWDRSFVLVFPLKNVDGNSTVHKIETEVGNLLLEEGIPVIDYYSHRY